MCKVLIFPAQPGTEHLSVIPPAQVQRIVCSNIGRLKKACRVWAVAPQKWTGPLRNLFETTKIVMINQTSLVHVLFPLRLGKSLVASGRVKPAAIEESFKIKVCAQFKRCKIRAYGTYAWDPNQTALRITTRIYRQSSPCLLTLVRNFHPNQWPILLTGRQTKQWWRKHFFYTLQGTTFLACYACVLWNTANLRFVNVK